MFSKRLILAAAPALLAAACSTPEPRTDWIDPGMGEATAWNKEIQTINPDPVYHEGRAQPVENGDKAAHAVKRYRTDQVNARH